MKITKTYLFVFVIFFLALFIRIYAANNAAVSTDEMVYSIIPLNIISAERLGTVEQSHLFFYLTDLGYKLLGGITPISTRLTSIIFGALSVFVIFLISKELFDQKQISLFAAFLFAFSGHAIQFNYEMDMLAYFFVLLSILFFIRGLKSYKNLYLATLFISLGILVKPIAFLFIPGFVIIWILYQYKQGSFTSGKSFVLNKKILKTILFCIPIGFLIVFPVISYNYLVYQEKGITDYFFSNVLGIGETVHQGMKTEWSSSKLINITKDKILLLLRLEALIFVFGILGLIYYFKKDKLNASFFLISIIFPFIYLAGQTGSGSHYLWISALLSIFAAFMIIRLANLIKKKFNFKYFPLLVVLAILIITFFVTIPELKESRKSSITLALREYTHQNIPENAIVVIDPRIYRGIHAWVFNDKHYIEGTYFSELSNSMNQIPGQVSNMPLYYIECNPKTNCGWKPEDFQRIFETGEQISNYFKEKLKKVAEVNVEHSFNIYAGEMKAPSGVYEVIDKTHQFWFYPVGWKYPEQAVDYYEAEGFDKVIESFGFFILWIDVIIALLSIPLVFYLGLRKEESNL